MIPLVITNYGGIKILWIILLNIIAIYFLLSSFSVEIAVPGGCGSSYDAGDTLDICITLSHNAYVTIWIVTSGDSWYIQENRFLYCGTHSFPFTVGDGEGTHTIYVRARSIYDEISTDSCSFYVLGEEILTPPSIDRHRITDLDGDGIPDADDDCYNPGVSEIDEHGCPRDSDEDGIPDHEDKCDFFPGPADNEGCPFLTEEEFIQDSDGDGWSDGQEQRGGTDPFNVDTDGDNIWDPQDPNPLQHESFEHEAKPKSQQSFLVWVGPLLFGSIMVILGGIYLFYRVKKKKEKKKKEKEKKDIKTTKKSEKVRKLKAQFVYGEISRTEYRKKLKKLEKQYKRQNNENEK